MLHHITDPQQSEGMTFIPNNKLQ